MRQQACTFRYKRSSGVSSRDYHERLARIKVSRAQMEVDRSTLAQNLNFAPRPSLALEAASSTLKASYTVLVE